MERLRCLGFGDPVVVAQSDALIREPYLYGHLRSTDQQFEVGASTGQCELIRAGYWITNRLRRERLASHFLRQVPSE
jgi:hypothetical protein